MVNTLKNPGIKDYFAEVIVLTNGFIVLIFKPYNNIIKTLLIFNFKVFN